MTYLQMSEHQCQRPLRMPREVVTHLCALLNDDLQLMGFGGHPMPVALKVTAALNFYASASFQGSTSNLCGASQSAVHRCIREVTNALYRRASDYVRFRMDPESQDLRALGFGAIAGFPQVQGVIDCTYVAIKAPAGQPAEYLNRKGFYSLNVQLAAAMAHSSSTSLRCHCCLLHLAGMAPDTGEKPHQRCREYNACHGSTRATIELAFGMLQMRLCCLDRSGRALQYAPDRVGRIVAVCCALHNFAIQRGEALQGSSLVTGALQTSLLAGLFQQQRFKSERGYLQGWLPLKYGASTC
ncbi:putative nuclease HARBI1 [Heterodontus francisci]|uniref:putative nuclease HARBI1 n=1 Tax=Heterodontus francisci TaxID=7792 RepID=UPI00355BCB21